MALKPATADDGVLSRAQVEENFADLTPLLGTVQARVEADRCLYCWEAPCIQACPTSIDIPTFIRQIRTENLKGSAETILSANILGGTCGRACPTEVLCEQSCVLNRRGEEPVRIGALQRHAVETLMDAGGAHPFTRASATGMRLAVVGAGPAGLAFAHRAALLGHAVTIFEAKPKPGGLNEYGLAAYKMADDFARREVEFVLGVGGVEIEYGRALGGDLPLEGLRRDFDAVFVGVGLGEPNRPALPGEDLTGVRDAIAFIEEVRQAPDKSKLDPGRDVVVIGGGNTAIDAAVQSKRLGARSVTLVYRRGEAQMGATAWEQDLARLNGVDIRLWSQPLRFEGDGGKVVCAVFGTVRPDGARLAPTGDEFALEADRVLLAVGQSMRPAGLDGLTIERGKIKVDSEFQTSLPGVFAGGDCIATGEDLTVQAVEDGKRAAHACDQWLKGPGFRRDERRG
jgi:glutamate synthase (NADPH/NADH) small chain